MFGGLYSTGVFHSMWRCIDFPFRIWSGTLAMDVSEPISICVVMLQKQEPVGIGDAYADIGGEGGAGGREKECITLGGWRRTDSRAR